MAAPVDVDDARVRAALVAAIVREFHIGAGVCADRADALARRALDRATARLTDARP